MKRLQAYKYKLKPNGDQQRNMCRFAGSCRFVFNEALSLQKKRYEQGEKKLSYAGLCKELTAWRNGTPLPSGRKAPWLADTPVHPLQQTLKDLERAYKNFFKKRADFPRFKKKGIRDSFRYPDPKQIKLDQANNRIFLPKIGWVRYRNSREVLGTVKNVTVSRSDVKWFVSIQTEREIEAPVHASSTVVGIDVGVARFATLSDGSFVEPLSSFKKHERKLAREQRKLARKIKFSNNWYKQRKKITRLHQRIANVRADFLHKTSTTISKNHAVVVLEDLRIKNMSASAKGSVETPGKNVNQKRGLNRSILDQGWFEFRRQLDYKQKWSGGLVLAVPPQNTSRTCPECGHVSADNRKTQAKFLCVNCGHSENADLVAAKNILAAGHAVAACGEMVLSGHSAKQEPAERQRHAA